jgi:S1-C subfamily serine protease
MKTLHTLLLLLAICMLPHAALLAQSDNNESEKKIIITKRSVDADGSEIIETIIKKGQAAAQFDADQYMKENNKDGVTIQVQVVQNKRKDSNEVYGLNNPNHGTSDDMYSNAFLGIEEDADEDENEPGLQVEVVKESAAAKAGLKTNDIILFLNGKQVNYWKDVTKLIRKGKPGDAMEIRYTRNGVEAVTVATLGTRNTINIGTTTEKHGFLGVQPGESEEGGPGTAVDIVKNAAAEKAGLKNGDRINKLNDINIEDWEDISDFMAETKPGDKIAVVYTRNNKQATTEAVIGTQNDWDWDNWNTKNWNWNGFDVNNKEKEACLGVYTVTYATDDATGAQIDNFTDESAAQEAGLTEGDVIIAINDKKVKSHDDLWNEIATYKAGEKVTVNYIRGDNNIRAEATLKACRDNANKIILNETNEEGDNQSREFMLWNWGPNEQNRMRERHVITIHKGEGDQEKAATAPNNVATDRSLSLESFQAYPNPTQGQVTIAFRAPAVPTVVSLFDLAGRQLFREELNAFNGDYVQQFDLSEYAKGNILIQVLQGNKIFTEQIIVN